MAYDVSFLFSARSSECGLHRAPGHSLSGIFVFVFIIGGRLGRVHTSVPDHGVSGRNLGGFNAVFPTFGIFNGFGETYNFGVFFGSILGIMEGRFPLGGILGVPLALALHVLLVVFERWTSSLITPKNSKTNPFLALMLLTGFVEVGTYSTLKEAVAESGPSKKVAETNGHT